MVNDNNTKGRVLVADDDPAILRLVTAVLEKEGFAVIGARDGREAYKALQDDPNFTAAVFDVVMPVRVMGLVCTGYSHPVCNV